VPFLIVIVMLGVLSGPPQAWSADAKTKDAQEPGPQADIAALREEVETLRDVVSGLAAQVSSTRPAVASLRLPDQLTLAGHPVPLDRWDVAERLEREFFLAVGSPAQAVLWLKRSARYFPYIEERLRAAGLPSDLKYVAVAESALRPRAYSWAHASGIWQFIPDTARRYGLRVAPAWDERRDPERSTAAAIAYLKDLYAQFRDWPLALAAYNAGERRVAAALKTQGVSEYYQLALPAETERYVFRILAAKLIFEAPDDHGFVIPAEERYAPHATDVITVPLTGSLGIRELAAAAGSFYREIRALNPAIMNDRLPAGRYVVRVPRGAAKGLAARLPVLQAVTAPRPPDHVNYRVQRGDTLQRIAERFSVSVDALRTWNVTARGAHIYPGNVLIIKRAARQ
jgi:membrane-bound lytic murein transglycosylase D